MGQRYTNHVSANPSGSAGGSGIMDLIAKLTGQDQIQGGPSIGPDGQVQFKPYAGSSGFLGARSRQAAVDKNDAYLNPMLMEQLRASTEMAKERERGTQDRSTLETGGKISNEQAKLKQALDIMTKYGIQYSPDDADKVIKDLNPIAQSSAAKRAALENNSYDNPNAQGATDMGTLMQLAGIKPTDLNQETQAGAVRPILNIPGVNANPSSQFGGNQIYRGSTTSRTTTLSGGIPMKMPDGTTVMVDQKPVVNERQNPATVTPSFSPITDMERAAAMQPSGLGGVNPNPSMSTSSIQPPHSEIGDAGQPLGPPMSMAPQVRAQVPTSLDMQGIPSNIMEILKRFMNNAAPTNPLGYYGGQ